MNEFTKSQKKIVRELIQKSLQADCGNFLNQLEESLSKSKEGSLSNHEIYLQIFAQVHDFDKYVAHRYDYIRGSTYYTTILGLLIDNVLTEDDLTPLGEEMKNNLISSKKRWLD